VADNAGGIAQMSHAEAVVRERTDALDSVGNTTAAIGKGFAIGSAALTALALFQNYADQVHQVTQQPLVLDLMNPNLIAGVMIGAMLPYLFSSLTMQAVGRAANKMVSEVRQQFREIPGLLEGTGEPDSARCVAISVRRFSTATTASRSSSWRAFRFRCGSVGSRCFSPSSWA